MRLQSILPAAVSLFISKLKLFWAGCCGQYSVGIFCHVVLLYVVLLCGGKFFIDDAPELFFEKTVTQKIVLV